MCPLLMGLQDGLVNAYYILANYHKPPSRVDETLVTHPLHMETLDPYAKVLCRTLTSLGSRFLVIATVLFLQQRVSSVRK